MITIEKITVNELCGMEAQGGFVFQDCPLGPHKLADQINQAFTYAGILRNGSEFKTVLIFRHNRADNMLLPFQGVDLERVKLVIWQLMTYDVCRGVFLPDFIHYELNGAKVPDFLSRKKSQKGKNTWLRHSRGQER